MVASSGKNGSLPFASVKALLTHNYCKDYLRLVGASG